MITGLRGGVLVATMMIAACTLARAAEADLHRCADGGRPYLVGSRNCTSRGIQELCLAVGERYWMGKVVPYRPKRDGALRFSKAHWVSYAVPASECPGPSTP